MVPIKITHVRLLTIFFVVSLFVIPLSQAYLQGSYLSYAESAARRNKRERQGNGKDSTTRLRTTNTPSGEQSTTRQDQQPAQLHQQDNSTSENNKVVTLSSQHLLSSSRPGLDKEKTIYYVEHVMKTGGTFLCQLHRKWYGQPQNTTSNCVSSHPKGRALFRPSITPEQARQRLGEDPFLTNLVMSEPGWTYRRKDNFGDMMRFRYLDASFWDTYTTILLVRDPVDRFLSYARMKRLIHEKEGGEGWEGVQKLVATDVPHTLEKQRTNFLTQHLVPGVRADPSSRCSAMAVAWGKKVIDRYDAVLNIADMPLESYKVLRHTFGRDDFEVPLPMKKLRRHEHLTSAAALLNETGRLLLEDHNRCDAELVAYANARVKEMAENVGDTFARSLRLKQEGRRGWWW